MRGEGGRLVRGEGRKISKRRGGRLVRGEGRKISERRGEED